jgi:hypothetical protein
MLKNNPVMKRLVATGEQRIGQLVQQLISNEKFVAGIQTIVSRGLAAKGALDKSLRSALAAMNLPSTGDLETLREKVEELETNLGALESKVAQLSGAKKK